MKTPTNLLTGMKTPASLLLVLATGLLVVISFLSWSWELDDALIYARYIDNFLSGNGLVYNAGERVNGLTSPLFAYLGIVAGFLLSDARDGLMLISIAALVGTALSGYWLLVDLGVDRTIATISPILVSLAAISYINLGMEVSLFTLLFFESIRLYLKNAHFSLGIVLALVILARPEGVFLLPILIVYNLIYQRPLPSWKNFVTPTFILLSQASFNLLYYGSLLSTSSVAKVYQGESGLWGDTSFLNTLTSLFDFGFAVNGNWFLMGALLLLAVAAPLKKNAREYLGITVLYLVVYTLFFHELRIPAQNWYFGIYFFVLWTYVAIGACWYLEQWGRHSPVSARIICALALCLLCYLQIPLLITTYQGPVRPDYREIGVWMSRFTPPDASIAMVEIGTVGWYSGRPVIDILGLVSPESAQLVSEGDMTAWTRLYTPDYMLVHDPVWDLEAGLRALQATHDVTEVSDFDFEGFSLYRIE